MASTRSDKMVREEAAKEEVIPLHIQTVSRPEIYTIKEIETFGDWLIVQPFMLETGDILIPGHARHENYGIVVGRSKTIMSPNGQYVESRLKTGDVVQFAAKSIVQSVPVNDEVYANVQLILLSERNVIFRMAPVPFKVVGTIHQS